LLILKSLILGRIDSKMSSLKIDDSVILYGNVIKIKQVLISVGNNPFVV